MAYKKLRLATTRADLLGRGAISYLRFSSPPQKEGSTLDRQRDVTQGILDHFGMTLLQSFVDEGVSAARGAHRKKGKLSDLLKMLEAGLIPRGTPLIIEQMDRLSREPLTEAFPTMAQLIAGGMVIITGDMQIWDEVTIDQPQHHKLVAEIDAAHQYVERLSGYQHDTHERQRDRLDKIRNGLATDLPIMNRIPGWIRRVGDRSDPASIQYELIEPHASTVRKMFALVLDGMTVRSIALWLNERLHEYPTFGVGETTMWRATRIGQLLNNPLVLGMIDPQIDRKRQNTPTKLYPAVIDLDSWKRVRATMGARKVSLRGPRGRKVANLFTGKVFCKTCGEPLRVVTGPRVNREGGKRHDLICNRYTESNSCQDHKKYDLAYYEPRLLFALIKLSTLVPYQKSASVKPLVEERDSIQAEIDHNRFMSSQMEKQRAISAATAERLMRLDRDLDALNRKLGKVHREIDKLAANQPHWNDTWRMIKDLLQGAVAGDVEKRAKLRAHLAPIDFRITGSPRGGLLITVNCSEEDIDPPPPRIRKPHRKASATAKAKVYAKRKFLRATIRAQGVLSLRRKLPKDQYEPEIGTPMITLQGTRYYTGQGWWNLIDPRGVVEPVCKRITNPKGAPMPDHHEKRVIDGLTMFYKGRGWWTTVLGT